MTQGTTARTLSALSCHDPAFGLCRRGWLKRPFGRRGLGRRDCGWRRAGCLPAARPGAGRWRCTRTAPPRPADDRAADHGHPCWQCTFIDRASTVAPPSRCLAQVPGATVRPGLNWPAIRLRHRSTTSCTSVASLTDTGWVVMYSTTVVTLGSAPQAMARARSRSVKMSTSTVSDPTWLSCIRAAICQQLVPGRCHDPGMVNRSHLHRPPLTHRPSGLHGQDDELPTTPGIRGVPAAEIPLPGWGLRDRPPSSSPPQPLWLQSQSDRARQFMMRGPALVSELGLGDMGRDHRYTLTCSPMDNCDHMRFIAGTVTRTQPWLAA